MLRAAFFVFGLRNFLASCVLRIACVLSVSKALRAFAFCVCVIMETRLQAAAAVSVGTYWPWEPTATLRSAPAGAVGSGALRRPQREERGGGILWRPPVYSLLN